MLIFEQEPAYILHRTPYQESRYLLELLTKNYGRMRAVASISRRKSHRQTEHHAPFRLLSISGQQKHELATIKHSEVQRIHTPNPEQCLNLWYLHDLLIHFLPLNLTHADIFQLYQSALPHPSVHYLRLVEYQLIQSLGLLPEISETAPYYQLSHHNQQSALYPSTTGFAHQYVLALYRPPPAELLTSPQLKALYQAVLAPHRQRPNHTQKTARHLKALLTPRTPTE